MDEIREGQVKEAINQLLWVHLPGDTPLKVAEEIACRIFDAIRDEHKRTARVRIFDAIRDEHERTARVMMGREE